MKKFVYKIFTNAGVFIETLPIKLKIQPTDDDSLVLNDVKITSSINGGQGQMTITTNRKFDNFDEGGAIDNNNIVQLFLIDEENPLGKLMFEGVLSAYRPYVTNNSEGVKIIALGRSTELQQDFYTSGGSQTFTKSSIKASGLFEDIIDNFKTVYTNSSIEYTAASVEDSGTSITLDFDYDKWLAAIKLTKDSAPSGWWWSIYPGQDVSGNNILLASFKSKPSTATHQFVFGRDIETVEMDKSMEAVVNKLYLKWSGGTTLFEDATSQAAYGVRSVFRDESSTITDTTTRDEFGDSFISNNKDVKVRLNRPLIVNNSYIGDSGQKIEDIKPGDTCKIRGLKVGQNPFYTNMQIVKTQYNGTNMTITLEQDFTDIVAQVRKNILGE